MLIMLLFFIYAVIGMQVRHIFEIFYAALPLKLIVFYINKMFGKMKLDDNQGEFEISRHNNFQNAGRAFLVLFRYFKNNKVKLFVSHSF